MRLVLLPGMDGTGVLFEPLLAALPPGLVPQIVSYPADEPLGYDALQGIVDAALPSEPFILVGESFSGPLAVRAAARRPPGLQALILCASFVRSPIGWFPRALTALVAAPAFALAPPFLRACALLGDHATPELRALLDRALAIPTAATMAARARALLRVDATADLRACAAPILYLRARDDRVVPATAAATITSCRPDVDVRTLAAPHLLLQVQPTEATRAIEELLVRSAPTARLG